MKVLKILSLEIKLILLSLMIVNTTVQATEVTSRFRGFRAVEQTLSERVLDGQAFTLQRYFSGMSATESMPLLQLLGGYSSTGAQTRFQNGEPNAVNMLMWDLVLRGFSDEVGRNCASPGDLKFNDRFLAILQAVCKWGEPGPHDQNAMEQFWLALVSYDAPEEEYWAWRDFFLKSSYQNRAGSEVVTAMVFAALYNPYFLLKQ